jgi:hypothetical protein
MGRIELFEIMHAVHEADESARIANRFKHAFARGVDCEFT